jgi:hypothetical protein
MGGGDWLVPVLILLHAAAYYWSTRSLPKPEINAILVGPLFYLTVAFVLYYLAAQCRQRAGAKTEVTSSGLAAWARQAENRKLLGVLAGIAAYILLMEMAGFTLSTILYMIITMRILGVKSWTLNVAITAATVGTLYWVFNVWLYIELPLGILDLQGWRGGQ